MTEENKEVLDFLKPGAEQTEVTEEIPPEAMMEVNLFDMVALLVKQLGITHVYGLQAGGMWPYECTMMKAGIARIAVRHEQTATFAAEAEARILGRPGMALIGPGTGITNASTGVVQAYAAQSPMFVLVGESGTFDDDMPAGQGIARSENQFSGITKWTRRVVNPQVLLWNIARGFRAAVTAPMGPVCVSTPYDFMGNTYSRGPLMNFLAYYHPVPWSPKLTSVGSQADPGDVEAAMRWLMEAERPTIIAGSAVHYEQAVTELQELVALTGIPTHARRVARGAISEWDPLNCCGRARGAVMRKSDRALVIGLRVAGLEGVGYPPFWGMGTTYVQAQPCREDVCLAFNTEYELIGNMKRVLRQMIDCLKSMGIAKPPEKWNDWRKFVVDAKERYEKIATERSDMGRGKLPLHPDLCGRLMAEFVHEELHDEYISCIDGFTASTYWSDWQKCTRSAQVMDASETIGIGHGIGQAIGAAMATDRKLPILSVIGDGAIGAAGMDIETAVRWDIPVVFVQLNNDSVVGGWWYFRAKACNPTGDPLKDSWEVLPGLRYDRMFKEFGCYTEFVERDVEVKPALKRAFDFVRAKSKPAFVQIMIDKDVLQEIWVTQIMPMCIGTLSWDEIPEGGQKLIKRAYPTWNPMIQSFAHPDWAEHLNE